MVIAQWRAAEAVLVLDSQTSAGCRVMTTVAMKDAVATANAALPSKREVPVKLSRVPLTGRRTHSHLMKRHVVTRMQRCLEICKTNAVLKGPLSIPGLRHIGRVETCTANLSLAPAAWSRRRPKRWSSSVTATTSVELGRFMTAVRLKDLKADWIGAPTCFPPIEQCMLIGFYFILLCFILFLFSWFFFFFHSIHWSFEYCSLQLLSFLLNSLLNIAQVGKQYIRSTKSFLLKHFFVGGGWLLHL